MLLRAGDSRSDQLAVTFDRTHVARPVVVEQITLDGLTTAAGDYRIRVDVRDLISNKFVVREQRVIVE